MTQTLDTVLESLQSDKNRLNFLRKIYTPGNIDVANRILAMSPESSSVIGKEMDYAMEHGQEDRTVAMGRRFVDYHIKNDFDISLRGAVLGWRNKPLVDYAITKLSKKGNEESLGYAAELCMAFGREDEGMQLTERIFDIQMENEGEKFPYMPAHTAVKLGRFDKAINLYLKAGYHWLDTALKVAKEHVPERVTEIATLGFNGYNNKNHHPEFYLESARVLGKEGEAEKVLKKEAKKLRVNHSPRCYEGLVKALVNLGLNDEARLIAGKSEARELEQMQTQKVYDEDNQRELACIFLALGDKEKAVEVYLRKIDKELSRNHPSHFMSDIDTVYQLTGDKSVLDKKIFVFERDGQYDKAAGLARELGRTDLTETYKTMQKMISAVQTSNQ